MGIHRLKALLKDKCPKALKEIDLKSLVGYKLACDASMSIYQFLISTQGYSKGYGLSELADKDGNLTGHLLGIFNRSIMMLENGIKPIWVFDGKPPDMKMELLKERKKNKEIASEKLETAKEADDEEAIRKYATQTVKITKQMVDDAKKLVKLLGLPVIEAPAEAEAQCVELAKKGSCYGVVSEDMDCLTFGTPILLNGFNSKDDPVVQIKLDEILKGLDISMPQFIDICILCGCDYTGSIQNIGPTKALGFIKEYDTIENLLEFLDEENKNEKKKQKYVYDLEQFKFKQARDLFITPDVIDAKDVKVIIFLIFKLEFLKPDVENLKKFLIEEKGFSENRVESGLKRIEGSFEKASQVRLDNFFKLKPTVVSTNNVNEKYNKVRIF